ncbi:hypothetical protein TPA0905_54300 [Streptomyces olivaceus]|nr:hypothetical protein TPA0905_54300 [Streptomyces olivaceus]
MAVGGADPWGAERLAEGWSEEWWAATVAADKTSLACFRRGRGRPDPHGGAVAGPEEARGAQRMERARSRAEKRP